MVTVRIERIEELRELVWGTDIPSPTCPEYQEHHRDIQQILAKIDEIIKEATNERK